jgi:hypothetical protein
MNNEMELDEFSKKIYDLHTIDIQLKDHQLAMIYKCIEIEDTNICGFGIMNDKPGTGKTYAILGLIYQTQKKRNIIVVPQNIMSQWCHSIHTFSGGLLTYKKFIDYSDLLDLYNEKTTLFDYDILITTSLYYNMIATTLNSTSQLANRVFFDEIDSISSYLINEINSKFIWFVSASFTYEDLGVYSLRLDKELLPYIQCKCKESFIDNMFSLQEPIIYKIICKNIYVDNIFQGLLSKKEFTLLNAMDYSRLKKKFHNRIAQNEVEAIDILVIDKLDIIEMEKIRIHDLHKSMENTDNPSRLDILKKQLQRSTESLEDSQYKLQLIRDRLKENDCCPLCYNEFNEMEKKVISPCCKNTICYKCSENWFQKLKKENCLYCNMENIKFEDYIIIKPTSEYLCILCDKEYGSNDDKYYATCCKKMSCYPCIKEWYDKLLKNKCLFCSKDGVLIDDFRNEKQYEEMHMNEQNGVKYTKKTKIDFIEYFIKSKIYGNNQAKVIICSNYIRIFNDIKKIFQKYYVNYIELDDGNINGIHDSVNQYIHGNIKVLLLNSNLFGCGMNLECSTDILFLHKTDPILEKQIVGRAQRPGRNSRLNIWYLMHENETIILTRKENIFLKEEEDLYQALNINIELNRDFYKNLNEKEEEIGMYTLL